MTTHGSIQQMAVAAFGHLGDVSVCHGPILAGSHGVKEGVTTSIVAGTLGGDSIAITDLHEALDVTLIVIVRRRLGEATGSPEDFMADPIGHIKVLDKPGFVDPACYYSDKARLAGPDPAVFPTRYRVTRARAVVPPPDPDHEWTYDSASQFCRADLVGYTAGTTATIEERVTSDEPSPTWHWRLRQACVVSVDGTVQVYEHEPWQGDGPETRLLTTAAASYWKKRDDSAIVFDVGEVGERIAASIVSSTTSRKAALAITGALRELSAMPLKRAAAVAAHVRARCEADDPGRGSAFALALNNWAGE